MSSTGVKILIGICSMREDNRFFTSVFDFISKCKGKYDLDIIVKKWKDLSDAQNSIADYFLLGRYDYLLLLDDDHSGHTVDMLDSLIGADAYMATIKTPSRHYPYSTSLYRWVEGLNNEGNCFVPVENGVKYEQVDMTGFPMTLLRRDLFMLLERPYFQPKSYGGVAWATDRFFCERLSKIGIKPVGVFTHCLTHDGINENNRHKLRSLECTSEIKMAELIANKFREDLLKSRGDK